MNDRLQTAFAALAGVLLVGAAAFGGVAGPGTSPVGSAEAQPLAGCAVAQYGPVVVSDVTGLFCNEPDTDTLEGIDAQETKKSIYDQASIQKQNNNFVNTAYSNYLNDTQSIALMEGKNAYIRALENGSAEAVARNHATEAVADYYATKQKNLISLWNTTITVLDSSFQTAKNTTGISNDYVYLLIKDGVGSINEATIQGFYTNKAQLVNGNTVDHRVVESKYDGSAVNTTITYPNGPSGDSVLGFRVRPPNDNYDTLNFLDPRDVTSRWNEIETQNDEVQSQLDAFVNNTYSSYQQGEINSSDLVDPYLGARDYDSKNSSSWTLRTLSSLGVAPPEDLSNVGRMNVSVGNVTYTGTLMSDGTPNGGYAVGGTYNASNITGAQFVALDDGGSHELTGEFTLESVTTADGEELAQNETVPYEDINYQTANTSEFEALQEDLDRLTAEINAKQQQERNAGGGGILPDFGSGSAIPGAVLIGGALVLLLNRA